MNTLFKRIVSSALAAAMCMGSGAAFAEVNETAQPTAEPIQATAEPLAATPQPTEKTNAVDEYAQAYQLYVSPDGDDAASGSKATPLKTLEGARNKVKSLRALERYKDRQIAVNFLPGEYKTEGQVWDKSDSGAGVGAETIYRAYEPGTANLRETIDLNIDEFKLVTDEEMLEKTHPDAVGKIYQMDLTDYLSKDTYIGFAMDANPPRGNAGASRLLLNNIQQQIARWPNAGCYGFQLKNGSSGVIAKGDKENPLVFKYDFPEADRWVTAVDSKAVIRIRNNWIGDSFTIKEVDTENKQISALTQASTGVVIAEGQNLEERWLIENLYEEIDIPGEYYIDVDQKILYYYPEHELGENDKLELIAGKSRTPLIMCNDTTNLVFKDLNFVPSYIGLRFNNGDNITVDGCEFRYGHIAAIMMQKCYNATIKNNKILSFNGGIQVNDGGNNRTPEELGEFTMSNNEIVNNYIWDCCRDVWYTNSGIITSGIGVKVNNNTVHATYSSSGVAGPLTECKYNEFFATNLDNKDDGALHTGRDWLQYGTEVSYNYFHDLGDPTFYEGTAFAWTVPAIYWDDTYSGPTQNHNIIVMNGNINDRAIFMNSSRDAGGTGNVIVNSETGFHNVDVYAWYPAWDGLTLDGISANAAVVQVNNRFQKSYKYQKENNTPYYQMFGAYMDTLAEDLERDKIFTAKNIVFERNVLIDTTREYAFDATLDTNVRRHGIDNSMYTSIKDNYIAKDVDYNKIFIDHENGDYRISDEGKKLLGIPDDGKFVLDKSFDLDSIGYQGELEIGVPFDKVYPREGETTSSNTNTVTLKWNKAESADSYNYKVYKKSDDSLVVAEVSKDAGAVVKGLEPNTEYYWTVEAEYKGRKQAGTWECAQGKTSFKTGDFDAVKKLSKDEIINNSVIMKGGDIKTEYKNLTKKPIFKSGDDKSVYVFGKKQEWNMSCGVNESEVLVPVKETAEAFGLDYSFDDTEKTATITDGTDTLMLKQDGNACWINGEQSSAIAKSWNFGHGMMMYARLLANVFDIGYYWYGKEQILVLSRDIHDYEQIDWNEIVKLYN